MRDINVYDTYLLTYLLDENFVTRMLTRDRFAVANLFSSLSCCLVVHSVRV